MTTFWYEFYAWPFPLSFVAGIVIMSVFAMAVIIVCECLGNLILNCLGNLISNCLGLNPVIRSRNNMTANQSAIGKKKV